MIPQNIGLNNLSRTGVRPDWPGCVSIYRGNIPETIHGQIFTIKILWREIFHLHHVFKTNSLESLIPVQYPQTGIFLHQRRCCRIKIKNNRLHRFHEFSHHILFFIFRLRLYSPPGNILGTVYLLGGIINRLSGRKISDSFVVITGTHLLFR